ncbi:MAG: DHA2 family efflux MFS transporter permease subunit, partial [Solirubrobacteraceae bacterium]
MSTTEIKRAEAPPTDRSRWIALVVLCVGMLMIVLDQTIVNVALPSIQHDLGFSTSSLAWVVNAYLIAFGGLLLLAGRLGDLVGRKRIFLTGLAVFTAASALCGLADSQALLVGARFVQGAGGALTSSVILGMIVTMFPEPREQAKAMGVFAFVASGGASVGLLAGGVLTQALDWHWIFFVNLPIGALATLLAVRVVAADRGIGLSAGADLPCATLVTGALMLAVYTIVKAADYGWGSAHTLVLGAVAVAVLVAFIAREATARTPLVPLRIFRSRNVTGANVVQGLMIAGMFGMFFLGAVYMQRVLGYDPLQVGLAYLPVALSIGALSLFVTPRLNMRIGPRATLLPGLTLMAAGLLLFASAPVHAGYVAHLLPSMLLLGLGAGLSFPSLMTVAMSGARPTEAGLASGLVNTSMQVGGALGLAVLAT